MSTPNEIYNAHGQIGIGKGVITCHSQYRTALESVLPGELKTDITNNKHQSASTLKNKVSIWMLGVLPGVNI